MKDFALEIDVVAMVRVRADDEKAARKVVPAVLRAPDATEVGLANQTALGLVSRVSPVQTALRNCTRDEGGPFEFGNQVLISSHRELLRSKAVAVSVSETSGQ